MQLALITALGVGGATIVGVLIGFIFQKVPHKFNDAILGFAGGIMLAAAVLGLIIPSMEEGNIWITAIGILTGAVFLNFADKITPHLHRITGIDQETHTESQNSINKVMLFVMAIAIHNLPEGIAAGVGFGSDNIGNAITVALGIALQNIPEGMIIVSPLIMAGVSKFVFALRHFAFKTVKITVGHAYRTAAGHVIEINVVVDYVPESADTVAVASCFESFLKQTRGTSHSEAKACVTGYSDISHCLPPMSLRRTLSNIRIPLRTSARTPWKMRIPSFPDSHGGFLLMLQAPPM